MTTIVTKEELIEKFVSCARRYEEFMTSDSKKASQAVDELTSITRQIKKFPHQGADVLRELALNESDNIATSAAVALLPIDEKFAKSALKKAQRNGGILGFNAEMSLKAWKAGRLRGDLFIYHSKKTKKGIIYQFDQVKFYLMWLKESGKMANTS